MFIIIFITFTGLTISTLLAPLVCCSIKIRAIRGWLDKKFKWNWTIRLLLEGTMEVSFCTVLTIAYVNRSSFGGYFNLIWAYMLFIAIMVLPIFIQFFFQTNFKRMSNPDDTIFDETYGAPYEGLKPDKRWSLFLPFMLCVRRLTFMIVVLKLHQSAYTQLWIV